MDALAPGRLMKKPGMLPIHLAWTTRITPALDSPLRAGCCA
jgi:hypothetical protein